jgi:AmiR/NasT family two-component response regulator
MKTGLSEEEAYLAIQRQAREARVSMRQAAEAIIAQAQPKSPA